MYKSNDLYKNKSKENNTIDVYFQSSYRNSPSYWNFMKTASIEASRIGYNLSLLDSSLVNLREYVSMRNMENNRVILVLGVNTHYENEVIPILKEAGRPFIIIHGTYQDDYYVNNITSNFTKAAFDITKHLIACGRKRIAFMGFNSLSQSDVRKLEGFKSALKESDLPFDESYVFEYNSRSLLEAIDEFVEKRHMFDAVVCSFDFVAVIFINCIIQKGIRVPDDIAVTGMDNLRVGKLSTPRLTTVGFEILGETAVKAAYLLDHDKKIENIQLKCKHKIIVRESCGAQKALKVNNKDGEFLLREFTNDVEGGVNKPNNCICEDLFFFDSEIIHMKMIEEFIYRITPVEIKILEMLISGMACKEQAQKFFISERAVRYHITKMSHKLNVSGGKELLEVLGRNLDLLRIKKICKRWFIH